MPLFSLYSGEVQVLFDPDGSETGKVHSYWIDGRQKRGVTSITGAIDKSGPLIGWALNEAERFLVGNWPLSDTGLGFVDETKRGWLLDGMKKAHEETRDAAASIGKAAHAWIEQHIRSKIEFGPEPAPAYVPEVDSAVRAYLAWEAEHHVEYLATEQLVYSRLHQYCGTLDIRAYVDGRHTLVDLKTSNGFRDEWRAQTAAYAFAYEEERPDDKFQDRWALILGKDNGKFKPVDLGVDTLPRDFNVFLAAKTIREWQEEVKVRRNGRG